MKKINASLIFTIILSVICMAFYGVINFVLIIFTDLARALSGSSDGLTNVIIIIVIALIISILCILNVVFSAVSFKYTRNNGEYFNDGKKKILTLSILLIINAIFNIVLMVLTFNSIILMILIILFALAFISISVVLLQTLKNFNNNKLLVNKK